MGVPTLIPMPVYFPANTAKLMTVVGTPAPNLGMGIAETGIRAEVRGSRHAAGWQLGAVEAVIPGKRLRHFRPDLNPSVCQIQGDVTPWARKASRANERPHFTTGSGNELRPLLRFHTPRITAV